MKMKIMLKALTLAAVFVMLTTGAAFAQLTPQERQSERTRVGLPKDSAQDAKSKKAAQQKSKDAGKVDAPATPAEPTEEKLEPDQTNTMPSDVPADVQANRRESVSEEQALIEPYYNNFFATYRLGPEDIISVTVFGQERYSRSGIVIPPNGKVSMPLIPQGVFVVGKTVDQVAEQIRKNYDEYIIDPKVDVSLDKAGSYRYMVIGDVAQPGVKPMSRRMTVFEALSEAGGVLNTGNKKKVYVLRRQASGQLAPIPVNIAAIEKGRAPDTTYLAPGDQIVVPGNKYKTFKAITDLLPVLSFARIFAGGL
jgi:polysaccharide export outer membrane protein